MTKKQLRVISKDENVSPGLIRIDTSNEDYPVLSYTSGEEEIIINGSDNTENLAKIDTLVSLLHRRDWNITTRPYLKEDSLYISSKSFFEKPVPEEEMSTDEDIMLDETYIPSEIYAIEKLYQDLVQFKGDSYSSQGVRIRLDPDYFSLLNFTNKTELEVFSLDNNSDYSNIINLNRFRESEDNLFKITVQYTIGGTIGCKDLIIAESEGAIYADDLITVEILDNVVRVFPTNPEITECIIQRCSILL